MGPRGLVFREAAEWREGAALAEEVAAAVARATDEASLVSAFLDVGALECALADAGASAAATAEAATDDLADRYLRRRPAGLRALAGAILHWPMPPRLRLSRPEGFAYYGLVPRELAEAAVGLVPTGAVTVVGLRSVGTTLSATVRAALAATGRDADRFTLRPEGDPYDRLTRLPPAQAARVRQRAADGASWIVVDEGPGLSGSSFLSAGEALVAAGAPAERVVFLGTREIDPGALVAPNASARWRRFRARAVPPGRTPPAGAGTELSAGRWRALFWSEESRWPATWPMLERAKWLSEDGGALFKFEGLGSHGARVHARALALAEAGLAPAPGRPDARGFVTYPFPAGAPCDAGARTPALVAALGRYCATRAALFPASGAGDLADLTTMARENVAIVLGVALPHGWSLPCARPIIADARLQPHEWLRTPEGTLLKTDGVSHGDDHLYPGPTDVAWDLAGAAVEWELTDTERALLVQSYRGAAGEDPTTRLPFHEIAYAAFRAAWCGMAAHAAPEEEAPRLRAARLRYEKVLRQALARTLRPGDLRRAPS